MSGTPYTGPINPNPSNGESSIIIYGYVPSIALAALGVATFASALLAHLFYWFRYKGYRSFHGLITVGSVRETHCSADGS